jgi:hypothetical protein
MAKFKEMERRIACNELAAPAGPCRLCGDSGEGGTVKFEYHDEDYSRDYSWSEPAAYVLCRECHIYRLHQRFARPYAWMAFLAHVRRGGYARDLKEPTVKQEVARYRAALQRGGSLPELRILRAYPHILGEEWFAHLSVDPMRAVEQAPRPRQ